MPYAISGAVKSRYIHNVYEMATSGFDTCYGGYVTSKKTSKHNSSRAVMQQSMTPSGWKTLGVFRIFLLLMAEIRHPPVEATVVYPIYRVSYIPGGAGFQPSTVVDSLNPSLLKSVSCSLKKLFSPTANLTNHLFRFKLSSCCTPTLAKLNLCWFIFMVGWFVDAQASMFHIWNIQIDYLISKYKNTQSYII